MGDPCNDPKATVSPKTTGDEQRIWKGSEMKTNHGDSDDNFKNLAPPPQSPLLHFLVPSKAKVFTVFTESGSKIHHLSIKAGKKI